MSFCCNCGKSIPDNAFFCPYCGTKVEIEINDEDFQQYNTQERTVFGGKIHKCPNCGESLPAFVTICPSCNCELRDGSTIESLSKLVSSINNARTERERIHCIRTFPIPNTKEDIYEFMILSASSFDEYYYVTHKDEEDVSDAWLSKIEQCYQKAKLVITIPSELEVITDIYDEVHLRIKNAESKAYYDSQEKSKTQNKSGFASWSLVGKILWIILNIYTIGIPAIIYSSINKKS